MSRSYTDSVKIQNRIHLRHHEFVSCHIDTRWKSARKRLAKIAYIEHASDGYDPWVFQCRSCGCKWDATDFAGQNFETVACSNCYSEKVSITQVRLEYITRQEATHDR